MAFVIAMHTQLTRPCPESVVSVRLFKNSELSTPSPFLCISTKRLHPNFFGNCPHPEQAFTQDNAKPFFVAYWHPEQAFALCIPKAKQTGLTGADQHELIHFPRYETEIRVGVFVLPQKKRLPSDFYGLWFVDARWRYR